MMVCPGCGAGGTTVMSHEIPGVYDGGLFWSCLACRACWNTWPVDHPRHAVAARYVAAYIHARDTDTPTTSHTGVPPGDQQRPS